MCGGIARLSSPRWAALGLSPRVRGNPSVVSVVVSSMRSIPARAGESLRRTRQRRSLGVYPRVCGGTAFVYVGLGTWTGLSPRVRGNLRDLLNAGKHLGSIPARAGEPRATSASTCPSWVYPRACGGTSHTLL